MYWNGVLTNGTIAMKVRQLTEAPGKKVKVRSAFCAAVAGVAMLSIVVLRVVAAAILATAAAILASASCSFRSQLVVSSALPVSKSELLERNE